MGFYSLNSEGWRMDEPSEIAILKLRERRLNEDNDQRIELIEIQLDELDRHQQEAEFELGNTNSRSNVKNLLGIIERLEEDKKPLAEKLDSLLRETPVYPIKRF
ncbi:MAG: hypothetical protein HYS32_03960 [Candidatus Woesearchaeota archaeon]|nr:MAG: hypothetical protein HYS32_03960 [Candidatus Woesearchaeota archaeon]